ncbi:MULTISPECIES: hypothetical protein [unclassified Fusobacterium]|uniref:hypothetical protein n=1 Tax=unclassified Fusobacterium TaxID=2648384 RepID=UPI001B8AB6C3|nr:MULTISPECIES: hypothetical protein [unclassified Fusobacterium]MBR8700501.1 hypothetical protein [Fusobacterium sp. DD45]MBR8710234.1 hypothetical protein [Fusobacterium sp. DD28]MBR8750756.1 hypothetical protein [Fusobacterium sp. DD26]
MNELVKIDETTPKVFKDIFNLSDTEFINEIESLKELNPETVDYIKSQTLKLMSFDAGRVIIVGLILNEVFKKIGTHHNGAYTDWLHKIGFEPRTALRYRNRASLFLLTKSLYGQKVILKLSNADIEKIMANEELKTVVLSELDKGTNEETIKIYIKNYVLTMESDEEVEIETEEIPENNEEVVSGEMKNISSEIKNKWTKLDKNKKKKISSFLKKIKEILES